MAASFESTQFERDLRSANKEWKRTKDSSAKWSHGSRPLSGVRLNMITGEPLNGTPSQHAKARPLPKFSDEHSNRKKLKGYNIVKSRGSHHTVPFGRVRTQIYAHDEARDEASRSLGELPPLSPLSRKQLNMSDNGVLYNFDRSDTPGRPLTLGIFVKTNGRDGTERLVEKEYEVLDARGEAHKGRKARRILRNPAAAGVVDEGDEGSVEDDGFELV
ncbi:hypothetical protein B0T17DRAFT_506481 [Bombardia bombarda]|uniref:Uncharacterized protein n=1 Tax=Bombardia bombarda TaxID=252184 RepID=A0AA39X9U5_9PEZI|nr:hypothetical protein B0T17DRAFT_506481 [Bombardia bombarda]